MYCIGKLPKINRIYTNTVCGLTGEHAYKTTHKFSGCALFSSTVNQMLINVAKLGKADQFRHTRHLCSVRFLLIVVKHESCNHQETLYNCFCCINRGTLMIWHTDISLLLQVIQRIHCI